MYTVLQGFMFCSMKNIILFAAILWFQSVSIGQPGYNSIKDLNWLNDGVFDMILDNDTIIAIGGAWENPPGNKFGLLLTKFDTTGNLLAQNLIIDSIGGDWFVYVRNVFKQFVKTSDGGYAFSAWAFHRRNEILFKVNHDLQLKWMHEIVDTINLTEFVTDIIEVDRKLQRLCNVESSLFVTDIIEVDSGYIIAGLHQRPDFYTDGYLARVGSDGQFIWFKYFGTTGRDDSCFSMTQIGDSTFVVGGGENQSENVSRNVIRIFDWHGTVLKTWKSEVNPDAGFMRILRPTPDGGYLMEGHRIDEPVDPFNDAVVVWTKLDKDFEVEWSHTVGPKFYYQQQDLFFDLAETKDGNYIACGRARRKVNNQLPWRPTGWVYKFSPAGDSLWEQILAPPLPQGSNDENVLEGVGVLSSGSIVMAGRSQVGNDQYIWLVKMTQDGCIDTIFCNTVSAFGPPPSDETPFSVYPNPVSQILTIEWQQPENGGPVSFSIYNSTGQLVRLLTSDEPFQRALKN